MKTLKLITVLTVLYTSFLANSQTDLLWAFNPTDSSGVGGTVNVSDIDVDQSTGDVYTLGYFTYTCDFDHTANVDPGFSLGNDDIFLLKHDAAGNLLWKILIGSTGIERGAALKVDHAGNIIITGIYTTSIDFDPGVGETLLTPIASYDIFIAKYSSAGALQWAKGFGGNLVDYPSDIDIDNSNNVYTVGYYQGTADFDPTAGVDSYTSASGRDGFLTKYDSNGNYQWTNAFQSTSNVNCSEIEVNSVDEIVVAGSFQATVDFDPSAGVTSFTSAGNDDVFMAKYTVAGALTWVNIYGDVNGDFPRGMQVDGADNIVIGMMLNGTVDVNPGAGVNSVTGPTTVLLKYTSGGAFMWLDDFIGTFFMNDIETNSSDEIIVAGRFNGTIDFDPSIGVASITTLGGSSYAYTASYNSSGVYQWVNTIEATSAVVGANGVGVSSSGEIYAVGTFNQSADFDPTAGTDIIDIYYQNGFITNYSSTGIYDWAGNIGGLGSVSSVQSGTAVVHDASNYVYVTGELTGTVDMDPSAGEYKLSRSGSSRTQFIAKYDENKVFQWANLFEDAGGASSNFIDIDGSGNLITGGYFTATVDFDPGAGTTTLTSNGSYDSYVSKYNNLGALQWVVSFGGTSSDRIYQGRFDASGNVYVSGSFWGTVDFDPTAGVDNRTAVGSQDVFLAKIDPNGNVLWVHTFGSSAGDGFSALDIDASGNVVFAVGYQQTIDFDPSANVVNLTSNGGHDIAVAKYDPSGNLIWLTSLGGTGTEVVYNLKIDNDEMFVVGSFSGTTDLDPGVASASYTAASGSDAFIVKLNSIGEYIWSNTIGGTGQDVIKSVDVDSYGHPYVFGYYSGTIDVDPSANVESRANNGALDAFVVQYDGLDGDYLEDITINGTATDNPGGISLDNNDAPVITGGFFYETDFDPTTNVYNLYSLNNSDIFVAKYDWAVPLPITLGGLSAFEDGDKNRIEWSTITERNVSHFEVEASIDGVTFDVIASTNAIGNSTTINNYSAIDYAPGELTYYRIKSVDNNGTFEYTNTVNVKRFGKSFIVYPNPGNEIVNISSAKRIELVEIYTTEGKVVLESELQRIDTSELVAGAYIIKVSFLNQEVETTLWMKR